MQKSLQMGQLEIHVDGNDNKRDGNNTRPGRHMVCHVRGNGDDNRPPATGCLRTQPPIQNPATSAPTMSLVGSLDRMTQATAQPVECTPIGGNKMKNESLWATMV